MRLLPILTILFLALPLSTLALPVSARAGTYEHHTISAASPGLDGWSPVAVSDGGYVGAAAAPGALTARFWARPSFAPGEVAAWLYTPPPDTTVAAWDVEWAVSGIGGGHWNTLLGALADGRMRYLAHDVPSSNRPWRWLHASGLGADRLVALLQCGGPRACIPAGTAQLMVRNARAVLRDGYGPVVTSVAGELAAGGALSGVAALSLHATDRGGGLYRAWAEVDGVARAPVSIGDARCRDLGTPYRFAYRQPCPLTAGATVPLDTTKVPDGRHTIAVKVEDAAGNAVTVYGPARRTVDNVPDRPAPSRPVTPRPAPPPAVNVSAWLARRGHRALTLTAAYGERVRLRGRVTDAAGRPLAGAALDFAEQIVDADGRPLRAASARGARASSWRALTGLRTRRDGRFTAFTRIGPSRRLRVSAGGNRAPLLTLRVRAPISVRRTGARVRGRLRGGYVPRGGALVELQTRSRRRWVTRRVVRTWASRRFSARLRPGAVRAVVPAQPGLPFVRGSAVSPPRTAGRTAARTSR